MRLGSKAASSATPCPAPGFRCVPKTGPPPRRPRRHRVPTASPDPLAGLALGGRIELPEGFRVEGVRRGTDLGDGLALLCWPGRSGIAAVEHRGLSAGWVQRIAASGPWAVVSWSAAAPCAPPPGDLHLADDRQQALGVLRAAVLHPGPLPAVQPAD